MAWLLDHLQIAVLVLLGVGSLIKSVMDSAAKSRRERSAGPPPTRDLSQDKSYRKRAPSVPPPLARPPAALPPALPRDQVAPADRLAGYEMETANEQARILKHQADLAERLSLLRESRNQVTGGAAVTRSQAANNRGAVPFLATPNSLRAQLRDPVEIRRAFIMREILDPPVGLR